MAVPPRPARRRGRGRPRVCVDCGREETVRSDNPSVRCRSCSGRLNGRKGNDTRRAARLRSVCAGCGMEFFTTPSAQQRYCTRACMHQAKRVQRVCAHCGRGFEVARSVVSGRTNSVGRYCSRTCYHRQLCRTERVSGRGSRWGRIRREAIRRTSFCALCGTMRRLDVHHIVPYRLTHDNSPGNLIPLCKKCHKKAETVFIDLEATRPDLAVARLVLWSSFAECRAATLMKLKSLWATMHG